ncbi:MAG TPA: MlaD family protein [Capillimicrobium sp.]|nr:MlaD family protein [Capillimicrobium sp.]
MRKAIRTHARDFAAIVGLMLIAAVVGGFILGNQRLYLPSWVPVFGSDFVDRKLELSTAQSITPGQGQEVAIAGVKVGEVGKVELVNGRAVVTMKIEREHAQLYNNATALVRPKTGLNDMTIQLDPGTPDAGKAPEDWAIPVSQTAPNVNPDEILAALDADTRDYLVLLLGGAAEGLDGREDDLANTFRRFEPTSRDVLAITKLLAERRENIRRSIHNFRLLTEAVAERDDDLAELVDASNAVFQSFANQDRALRSTLQQLPGTLDVAQTNLAKAGRLARTLGPTLESLRPAARSLGPTLQQLRPFLRESTPIIRDEIRPFARESLPTVRILRPAARNLSKLTPDLTSSFKTVNQLLNELAYNPPGPQEEGYLFWLSWLNHAGVTLFSTQDAHGPIRKGVILASCTTLQTLPTIAGANQTLGVVLRLANLVRAERACPKPSGAGSGTPPSTTGAGTQGETSTTPTTTTPTASAASADSTTSTEGGR